MNENERLCRFTEGRGAPSDDFPPLFFGGSGRRSGRSTDFQELPKRALMLGARELRSSKRKGRSKSDGRTQNCSAFEH
jgi:hypothetical protein